jgi:predicted Rossmann fold flavoprotein
VIGGGPAGLFCAISAEVPRERILVIEKKQHCGRKLLITGSGQCNITHEGEIISFLSHYGDNGRFLKPSLMNFTNRDLLSFFTGRGLHFETEPGGKIFPKSRKATDILDLLMRECIRKNILIHQGEPVSGIEKTDHGFYILTEKAAYLAEMVVIATGGLTYPATGSTGDGFGFAQSLGHQVTDTGPALTSVYISDHPFSDLSGISCAGRTISIFRDGKQVRQHTGDILFTRTGLSGPGILDISRFMRPGDMLKISFLSGIDPRTMKTSLIDRITAAGNRQVKTIVSGYHLPERLTRRLLEIAGIEQDLTGAHLSKKDRTALIEILTACPVMISRLGGFNEAMVTRGGVSLDGVNPKTMESRIVQGLFFIGEVLDIDGDCGGYNLQAAFSTGILAAKKISGYISSPGTHLTDQFS